MSRILKFRLFGKATLSLLVLVFGVAVMQAQTVSGQLVDDTGEPLIGANVIVQGTTNGTITDIDGNFELAANPEDMLVISYIGFVEQVVPVGSSGTVNVTMAPNSTALDEVVVIGYGTSKKSHLTGAISKVDNKDLDKIAVSRVDDALVGQVSGVNIAATEGEAGSAPTIRIRGTGSMVASSDPLIVVDGLIVDNDFLGSIDMNDVASFEILKDAASCAIYGSRGGNGVILITTKDGVAGDTKFTYNGFVGVKSAHQSEAYTPSIAETVSAEMAANGELSDRTKYKQLIGVNTNWQDEIFDGGMISSHSLSARGGNKNTNFSTTFGFLNDEGVLLTDEFTKYNLNFKIRTKIGERLNFGASVAPSYTNRRRFDGSTHDILRQTVWMPVHHDANTIQYVDREVYPDVQIGDYAVQRHFDNYINEDGNEVDISNTSNTNPAAKVLERDRNDYKFKLFGNTFLEFKIADGLKFKTVLSGDYQDTEQDRWQGLLAHRNGASNISYDVSNFKGIHLVNENYFSYNKEIGNHEIGGVLGISAERWDYNTSSISATGYENDLIQTISGGTTISSASSDVYQDRFASVFGRVNYAFAYKYLLSASFRRDGSSRFGADSKYGVFPAISAGWVISEEGFLGNSNMINFLKLRASYGLTGNNAIRTGNILTDFYPSLASLQPTTAVVDGNVASGIQAANIANNGLGWESSREINPGIDFELFNSFLSGSVDYYNRTSDNLLLNNPISYTTGFSEALVNLGKVENKGYEVELRTNNIRTSDFTWTTTLLGSRNENTLIDFADSDGQIQNVDSKRAAEWINMEGLPISSFYGWVVDRDIDPEFLSNAYHPIGAEAQDVYVKDLNGDGIIDDDDKAVLGNPYPDFVWSIGNNVRIRDIDLGLMFQGSHGAEIRNMGDQYLFNHFNSAQDFTSDTPDQQFIKQKIFTDDIIQDASYVSLRNITLGYNFGSGVLSNINAISKARIYVAGQNLWYKMAEDYTGLNPESINNTSPTTWGYQRAGSPINKTFTVGLNVEF